jgi:hypothetical protein
MGAKEDTGNIAGSFVKINIHKILQGTFFFPKAQQPLVGQYLLIIRGSRSRSFRHTTLGRTPLDE